MADTLVAPTFDPADLEVEHSLNGSDIVVVVILCMIYALGFVSNLLVIFVISLSGNHEKSSHWYVLQLTLADFIFLNTIPFRVHEGIHRKWAYPTWTCKGSQAIIFLCFYASILFLTALAIDRYAAICHPLSRILQKFRSRRVTVIITSLIWIVSLMLCTPIFMYTKKIGFEPNCLCGIKFPTDHVALCKSRHVDDTSMEMCIEEEYDHTNGDSCMSTDDEYQYYPDYFNNMDDLGSTDTLDYMRDVLGEDFAHDNGILSYEDIEGGLITERCIYNSYEIGWSTFLMLNFAVMFVLPLAVITICYGFIIRRVLGSSAFGGKDSTVSNNDKRENDKKRATIVCAVLVITFALCWLPFHAFHIAKIYGIRGGDDFCNALTLSGIILAYINAVLDPYLYAFVGKNFRKQMKTVRERSSSLHFFIRRTSSTSNGFKRTGRHLNVVDIHSKD